MVPSVPPTPSNPVFLYFEDDFQRPYPFQHDIAVATDVTYATRLDALDAHESQFYEWLPWVSGVLDEVPEDVETRKTWLAEWWTSRISSAQRAALERWYGPERAAQMQHAESFQIAEYGHQPSDDEIRRLFPMLDAKAPTPTS